MAKLLLVDDDEGTLTWRAAALTSEGHVVRTAAGGRAALETAEAWTPDLILADIMMPEMDGFAFSRLVQAHRRVPVMLVSALKKEAEAILRGVAGYVQKPVTAAELRAAVDRVLGAAAVGAVLVVDDDADVRQCYRHMLEPRFTVLEAENGRRALGVLATRDVALLIVDVHMPVMNGVELVRAIRADPRLHAIPVIVQTSDRAAACAPIWTDLQVEQTVMKNDFMEWLMTHIDEHLAAVAGS
ncbi:MAG TPA: response regulator [Polyangiaceae bacterium]